MKSFLLLLLAAAPLVRAQEEPELLDPKVRDLLHASLSGDTAWRHVAAIAQYHRIQGSRRYRDAAHYVLNELRSYGFSEQDASIESFVSDGKKHYQTWQSPSGWDVTEGGLSMVSPSEEKIVSFPDAAMSVMTYSNPGDASAEVVSVGEGTHDADYRGKDVAGKFVLASGYGGDVHRLAVLKYGAKAVVCYPDDERASAHPDMIQYTGIWPRTEELARVTFGFNISKRQGERIKALLASGTRVVLHGWVKGTGLEPYYMDVVAARIRGIRSDEQLLFTAHLDHPKFSANDNASGSGAILDVARTLKALIAQGKLPQPRRSITFLWVPEWFGTMAWIDAHPEAAGPLLGGKLFACMNLDMVGENADSLHSRMTITRTPMSLGSCVNDVVANMAAMTDRLVFRGAGGSDAPAFNYRITPYAGGSDHMMFIDRKVPAVMFSHTDWTHHTSEDTPGKVDPAELARTEMIAASTIWHLASLSPAQALAVIDLVRANAGRRIGMLALTSRAFVAGRNTRGAAAAWAEAANMLNMGIKNEIDAASSVVTFNAADNVRLAAQALQLHLGTRFQVLFDQLRAQIEDLGYTAALPPPLDDEPDARIPERLTRGPLDLRLPESRLPAGGAAWYDSTGFPFPEDERFELVNFIDGKRSVSEIRDCLSAEFAPVPKDDVARYLDDLVQVKVVKWKK